MKKKENFINNFLDDNKKIILGIMLILIAGMTAYLLWRDNRWKPDLEKRVILLEEKTSKLENDKAAITSVPVESIIQASSSSASVSPVAEAPKPEKSSAKVSGKININSAGMAELDLLPGIGMVYAQRIVDYRSANGNYRSIEDIKKIKGIGEATFKKIKDLIAI